MNRTIKLAAALLIGLTSSALAQDIKVGTIFPLSGGAGPDGQTVTNAVKLMVQQINDKGGLLGRKLVVVSKDDESTPAVGVSRANEMIAEKVDVVIEGWNSPVTLAMQPILARAAGPVTEMALWSSTADPSRMAGLELPFPATTIALSLITTYAKIGRAHV